MPGSRIVIPYQFGAASIVVGLCVISKNWLRSLKSLTRCVNFSTLTPSSGASPPPACVSRYSCSGARYCRSRTAASGEVAAGEERDARVFGDPC